MNDHFPDEWLKSETTTQFFGRLPAAPVALLMLDYDGTLAPFSTDRLSAIPYPGVKDRLERLAAMPRVRIALISGRSASELQRLLNMQHAIEIWGSHGREHIGIDGSYRMQPLTDYERGGLESIRQGLVAKAPADCIETKPSSVAVHWRGAPSLTETLSDIMQRLYRNLPNPGPADGLLRLLAFDGGLELRAGLVNKGHAVESIIERFSSETPAAFLGDDATDEDAFRILRERGLAVLVREQPRRSYATLWLRPPGDLLLFLDAWTAAMETQR